jgi:tricorn protease
MFHALVFMLGLAPAPPAAPLGYYRHPALHERTIVFTAEGDLWTVGVEGGVARRLTSHAGVESHAALSPDGETVAFTATYEGPGDVYTMPLAGGLPTRRTWEGRGAKVAGWTPDGRILYSTSAYSTMPNDQLVILDAERGSREVLPLSQAADGSFEPTGRTLFFTRLPFQGSHTRRYAGGTAQRIWSYAKGEAEAKPLTADFPGTSKEPLWWKGRVYFLSDRDGTMNLWSMDETGADLRQHTRHKDWDVQSAALSAGRVVYQLGADLRLFDVATEADSAIDIRLASDFDQRREHWLKTPMEYVTSIHLSPTGDRLALTARGEVWVVPATRGRLVQASRDRQVRNREARFLPDGKGLVTLSDKSGEVELWQLPANGVGNPQQLTSDGSVLRWDAAPSPDGKWIAHHDKDEQLWLYEVATRKSLRIASSANGDFADLRWAPDSRWLVYAATADNLFSQLFVYGIEGRKSTPLTTDRYDSYSPSWSADGKWLYFLSDRHLESLVRSPWGPRQPEPFFDRQTRIYELALTPDLRSPFRPPDELAPPEAKDKEDEKNKKEKDKGNAASLQPPKPSPPPPVAIDLENIQARLAPVPAPPGNYESLATDGKLLYWLARETTLEGKKALRTLAIENKGAEPETFMDDVASFELSQDSKKILVRKGNDLFVFDVGPKAPTETAKSQVNLKDWTFPIDPKDEWRQMFTEAWRLERDYFYDRKMHGVDWKAMREKYAPLVERVSDRHELSNLLGQMVSELSALHIFVYGGDERKGTDDIEPGFLGASLTRDEAAGGYRVEHVLRTDPDEPENLPPLARPGVGVGEGDVLQSINGTAALSVPDVGALLRGQAGRQVLVRVKPKGAAPARDVVVTPVPPRKAAELAYDEWEYARREIVRERSAGRLGYVHLQAMGSGDVAQWARDFYPAFDRDGLIIDVRGNGGGNIDSWILEKLLRKAWFFWQPRVGRPYWNMQYAFRGPMVVLCDEGTASDGEAFSEGFRRLGLGKVIGTRTWGGEIWLTSSNVLVDKGIATAAEFGVYGPEGAWLIEGHGVDPDIVVDNLPHATFGGSDVQLDTAIRYLQDEIKAHPRPVPPAPAYPDKSHGAPGAP